MINSAGYFFYPAIVVAKKLVPLSLHSPTPPCFAQADRSVCYTNGNNAFVKM